MYNKLKEITGLEWTELTTVIVVLAVGYPFLSKYGFYNRLGIDWYINTGNAFSIFLSSISVMFWEILGVAFSFLFYRLIIISKSLLIRHFLLYGIMLIVFFLVLMPILYYNSFEVMKVLLKLNYVGIAISLCAFICFLMVLLINANLKDFSQKSEPKRKNLIPVFSILIILHMGVLAWTHGRAEADNVWKYRSQILNSLNLGNPKEKWYLVDYTGDKALILKDGSGLIFKIVEYKEMKEIKPPEQEIRQIYGIVY